MDDRMLVTYDGKLYDITGFVAIHPGGREILRDHVGRDITQTMQHKHPHHHSDQAYNILRIYFTGDMNGINLQTDPLDWDKPIFEQIPSLADKYFDWVHTPVDRHLRLFHSDFIEFFSKCPWWMVPSVWFPVTCFLLLYAYIHLTEQTEVAFRSVFGGFEIGVRLMPGLFAFGLITWTFLEYVIHRWLFHMKPPRNNAFLIMTHFILHGQHHKAPMDRMRLVFPTFPATIFAIVMFYMFRLFWPFCAAMTVMAGNITGYMYYDLVHYYLHHGGMLKSAYFRDLKSYHMDHHFTQQQLGFGISSKLWDYPFGTLIKRSY